MTFLGLGACLALAAFLLVTLITTLIVCVVWRQARHDADLVGPQPRATGLFLLRVLPTTAGAVFALGVFAPAFYRYEPRGTAETVGVSLGMLAAVAVALIVVGVVRAALSAWATHRLVRRWMRDARPISIDGLPFRAYAIAGAFPVVSVAGVVRPRLFISDHVLEACTHEEVAAIARHECAHVASLDNVKRLALRLCADPLAWLPVGRRIERQWESAAEEAADENSIAGSPRTLRYSGSALELANALVRVARMMPRPKGAGAQPAVRDGIATLPAFFYQGGSVERRVRRLLDSSPRRARAPWIVATRVLALVPPAIAVAALTNPAVLRAFHAVLEAVVETLP